ETPYEFFRYFWSEDLFEKIACQSTLYSTQKSPENPIKVTAGDVRQYFGICIFMSVVKMPSIRSYWDAVIGSDIVRNTITCNRFEKLRSVIHFNDNVEDTQVDRLYKIRPVVDHLRERFLSVPKEKALSLDEQL